MTITKAFVQHEKNEQQTLTKEEIELPKREPHQSLVKVLYVAQNPTDIQTLDSNAFGDGTVLGCDFVGTVEETGEQAKLLKKGDLVAGLIWGGEIKGLGAYSEHTFVDDRISFKVPEGLKPEDAATVPLACCTSWLALFSKSCLDMPRRTESTSLLIWGGSSSVGCYAIQLAAMYGMDIITTCSPQNFDMVKKLGAKHVFDYKDDSVIDKIKEVAPTLAHVFDTIGNTESSAQASEAVNEKGGTLCTVRPGKANTENVAKHVKVTDVLVWTAFLKEHNYGKFKWPASKSDHELSAKLFEKLPEWLTDGTIKPNKVKLYEDLDKIDLGFDMYRDGKISSYKIVYGVESNLES